MQRREISVPCILIYKKSNFLVVPPNSLNETAGVTSPPELISQTEETMIRQSAFQELEKQKPKVALDQEKKDTNANRVTKKVKVHKSQLLKKMTRGGKVTLVNLDYEKKGYIKIEDNKRKKENHDNLNDN